MTKIHVYTQANKTGACLFGKRVKIDLKMLEKQSKRKHQKEVKLYWK
jgi:hypothetical protein